MQVLFMILTDLFHCLDKLTGPASLADLNAWLRRLDVDCTELTEFIRFSHRHYTRNLVRAGPFYHLLVLCWINGQRSPIHDHLGSSCGVRVLRGAATETFFEFAANGLIKATSSRELALGGVCASQDTDIHQLSNLQPGPLDLVTLHVYSPPLLSMGTYSLTDRTRGQEPMFVEFSDAAGI
jgi:cysteine dioxygenase